MPIHLNVDFEPELAEEYEPGEPCDHVLEFELNAIVGMSGENPLSSNSIEADSFSVEFE